jgi:hypothetical protein
MLGVLVFGFCGFLSFVSACVGFLRGLVDCGYLGFDFCVGVPRAEMCVFACFFSSASASAEKLHDVL